MAEQQPLTAGQVTNITISNNRLSIIITAVIRNEEQIHSQRNPLRYACTHQRGDMARAKKMHLI